MSVAQPIAPHLPYLRRFARALTGSQRVGDVYVQSALEAIMAEPRRIDPQVDVRVSLYKVLLEVWRSVPIPSLSDPSDPSAEAGAQKTLEAMTPRSRIAFLLRSLEGLTIAEVAAVMDCSPAEAQDAIEAAGHEIADQIRTDVLIIEDEPLIAMQLEDLVSGLGHTIYGTAATRTQAREVVGDTLPGLVLADIQLADGSSGLDAVDDILGVGSVPVIFITAYPERLLTGDRPEPTYLVTKPFQEATVRAAISQALFFQSSKPLG